MSDHKAVPAEQDLNLQEIRRRIGSAKKAIAEHLESTRIKAPGAVTGGVIDGGITYYDADAPEESVGADEEIALQMVITERLADVELARERMRSEQLELERLKFETRVMIAKLRGVTMVADVWKTLKTHAVLADDLQTCYAEIKEIREELRDLTLLVHDLVRHDVGTKD